MALHYLATANRAPNPTSPVSRGVSFVSAPRTSVHLGTAETVITTPGGLWRRPPIVTPPGGVPYRPSPTPPPQTPPPVTTPGGGGGGTGNPVDPYLQAIQDLFGSQTQALPQSTPVVGEPIQQNPASSSKGFSAGALVFVAIGAAVAIWYAHKKGWLKKVGI